MTVVTEREVTVFPFYTEPFTSFTLFSPGQSQYIALARVRRADGAKVEIHCINGGVQELSEMSTINGTSRILGPRVYWRTSEDIPTPDPEEILASVQFSAGDVYLLKQDREKGYGIWDTMFF